jgi:hypothetical protein
MSDMSSGKRLGFMALGIIIIIVGFFGSFFSIFWLDDWNIGSILFRMMLIPFASFIIGAFMIIYATGGLEQMKRRSMFFGMSAPDSQPREKSYIYEPPDVCPNCKGAISSEDVEWVGPLSARCPYCGATLKTEKREI